MTLVVFSVIREYSRRKFCCSRNISQFLSYIIDEILTQGKINFKGNIHGDSVATQKIKTFSYPVAILIMAQDDSSTLQSGLHHRRICLRL